MRAPDAVHRKQVATDTHGSVSWATTPEWGLNTVENIASAGQYSIKPTPDTTFSDGYYRIGGYAARLKVTFGSTQTVTVRYKFGSVGNTIQKNLSEAQLSDYATTVVLKSGVWVNLPHCCLRDNDRKDFEPEEVWHNTASEFAPLYIQFYVTSPSPVYAGSVRVEMQSVVTLNYRPEDSLLHTATHVGNKQIPTP